MKCEHNEVAHLCDWCAADRRAYGVSRRPCPRCGDVFVHDGGDHCDGCGFDRNTSRLSPSEVSLVHQAYLTLARCAKQMDCPVCGAKSMAIHDLGCEFGRALDILVDHLPPDFFLPPRSQGQHKQ